MNLSKPVIQKRYPEFFEAIKRGKIRTRVYSRLLTNVDVPGQEQKAERRQGRETLIRAELGRGSVSCLK